MGIDRKNPHMLIGVMDLRRLISFFEIMGNCAGVGLWTPDRLCNTDLARLAIPIATDNRGNYLILGKLYAMFRSCDWLLREMDVRNLTNSVAITSKHARGDSGTRSVLEGWVGRNPHRKSEWGLWNAGPCERFGFLVC